MPAKDLTLRMGAVRTRIARTTLAITREAALQPPATMSYVIYLHASLAESDKCMVHFSPQLYNSEIFKESVRS